MSTKEKCLALVQEHIYPGIRTLILNSLENGTEPAIKDVSEFTKKQILRDQAQIMRQWEDLFGDIVDEVFISDVVTQLYTEEEIDYLCELYTDPRFVAIQTKQPQIFESIITAMIQQEIDKRSTHNNE